ncbi:hypothetical protein [Actinokineospora sp. UTMC 2448]|uniref:hypothetical protein n=1 Tax=Actinokineospora sp. UTMC 2448 TaxID=2268449 RepID=UPI002164B03C|nr:hypothetical protein [Actinokineospora sp. UTMC 2448]UVS79107.1 hypothetical protein Actkin_02849 [Actinokineospora sp. UTMC 2448]
MYFRITEDSVELVEPENLTAFHAVRSPGLGDAAFAESVRRAGLGEPIGDGHLMVSIDAVRRLAAGRVGPDWADGLAKMVAYAAGKGWVDETGARVRAHVEIID